MMNIRFFKVARASRGGERLGRRNSLALKWLDMVDKSTNRNKEIECDSCDNNHIYSNL